MIVSINQPAYLPWLGYFHRIEASDLHIVLDHVQFEKNSFTNRNKIRTATGWTWLTVPVRTKGRFGDLAIDSIAMAEASGWRRKHWDSIRFNYARTPWFSEHAPFFEEVYATEWPRLSPLMSRITRYLLSVFGIETEVRLSSEMGVTGEKAGLVRDLCQAVDADVYLSGPLGRDYLNPEHFLDAGITLDFHDYRHQVYSQAHGGFEPFMAAIDLLFNRGPESKATLCHGQ